MSHFMALAETAPPMMYAEDSSPLPNPTIDREEGPNTNEEQITYTGV